MKCPQSSSLLVPIWLAILLHESIWPWELLPLYECLWHESSPWDPPSLEGPPVAKTSVFRWVGLWLDLGLRALVFFSSGGYHLLKTIFL